MPISLTEHTKILVLVHGTPNNGTAIENAGFFAYSWKAFAEEHDYILIVPAFDQENFSSRYGDRAGGGYRGLFGRQINADVWVLRLVDSFRNTLGLNAEKFYLYGHSAGGQFVGRFLVMHPELIHKAVITSAATYPQPDIDVKWPFGMGELHEEIVWDDGTIYNADIVPDKKKWLLAVQVPLTVIVGLDDDSELPPELLTGQKGRNRFTIARNWVNDMSSFAAENEIESEFKLELIPGIGHSMTGLMPFTINALIIK